MRRFTLYTDGAARGNPGPAGAGWLLCDSKDAPLVKNKKYLGELTNNQAEYQALLLALKALSLQDKLKQIQLQIFSDSELLVRQLKGEYKVKNQGLKPLFQEALLTLAKLGDYSVNYIPREKNDVADALANEAIDEYFS